eukprot:GFYU01002473.1.p1 GENE.GFYU01002473.1~~GFYU01002473.1.p1  ORF type:complete len:398 (-),score=66.34 GFYU01002473.1:95-1288(-)
MCTKWVSNTVSVMHMNVLCEIYQPDHLPDGACKYENRKKKIFEQIESNYCDVVTLQEANPISDYRSRFGDQYDIVFVSKSDKSRVKEETMEGLSHEEMLTNVNDSDDGHCIMVKKNSQLELIRSYHLAALDPPEDAVEFGKLAVARHNMLAVHCYHKATKKSIMVCGMHMKATRDGHVASEFLRYERKRLFHLNQLMSKLYSLRQSLGQPAVIFAGDFNVQPYSDTMRYLLEGRAVLEGNPMYRDSISLPTLSGTVVQGGGTRLGHSVGPPIEFASVTHESIERTIAEDAAKRGYIDANHDTVCRQMLTWRDFFTLLDSSHGAPWKAILDYIMYEKSRFRLVSYTAIPYTRGGPTCASDSEGASERLSEPGDIDWGTDAILHSGSDHMPIAAQFVIL